MRAKAENLAGIDKNKVTLSAFIVRIANASAFLPLVILIFTNKDLSGKQKGIVGSIAVVALLIAGVTGVDFNPPSQEQYAEQTKQVEALMGGVNQVYWTKSGKSYHLYQDCSYINSDKTVEIFEGTVAQALCNSIEIVKGLLASTASGKYLDTTISHNATAPQRFILLIIIIL